MALEDFRCQEPLGRCQSRRTFVQVQSQPARPNQDVSDQAGITRRAGVAHRGKQVAAAFHRDGDLPVEPPVSIRVFAPQSSRAVVFEQRMQTERVAITSYRLDQSLQRHQAGHH